MSSGTLAMEPEQHNPQPDGTDPAADRQADRDREAPIQAAEYARMSIRRYIAIVFVLGVLFSTFTLWVNEYHSCERSNATRVVLIDAITKFDLEKKNGIKPPRPLNCAKLLPDH